MVRPERVRVGRHAPGEGSVGVPVTVREVIFRGATVHVELATADGSTMVAHLTDERSLEGIGPGETAWAHWNMPDAYLVPAASGHPEPVPTHATSPGGSP
jgi:hypothetical protein